MQSKIAEPFVRMLELNRMDYREFMRDKRVVLVGPAPSIIGSKQGKFIDSFPVVVRLNRGFHIPPQLQEDIGTRTDILYHNCLQPPDTDPGCELKTEELVKRKIKFLVSAYPYLPEMVDKYRFPHDIANFARSNDNRVKFCCFEGEHFRRLEPEIQLPNAGFAAILDLLSLPIKQLYITGITFFRGGYYREYRPYNEEQALARMDQWGVHNQVLQLRYAKTRLKRDTRVRMDPALCKIIYDKDMRIQKHVKIDKTKENKPSQKKMVQIMRLPDRFILPSKLIRD